MHRRGTFNNSIRALKIEPSRPGRLRMFGEHSICDSWTRECCREPRGSRWGDVRTYDMSDFHPRRRRTINNRRALWFSRVVSCLMNVQPGRFLDLSNRTGNI